MSMKRYILPIVFAMASVAGGAVYAAGESEEAREKTIALSSVPKTAVDAAKQALGAEPTEAKIINGTRPQQYELAVESGGKEQAVHVRANGTIVKREAENEEHEKAERGR
jgi:cytochrome c556